MKAAFTIVTSNYISYAKTLGDSILKHNSKYKFFICLLGSKKELGESIDLSSFKIIEIDELTDHNITLMRAKYSFFELSCALKPYFADHILKEKSISRLKYFDSDIMVFCSFNYELENQNSSSIFLTPHFFNAVDPSEYNTTNDAVLLKSGIYNAGYFEVANDSSALLFLQWWKERLFKYCFKYKNPYQYIFVDQSWLNLVPIYFDGVFIIRNCGYNTSFYNLHERKITESIEGFLINDDEPMIFFHFTGYKFYNHADGSLYNPTHNYNNTPFLEKICNIYKLELVKNLIEITYPIHIESNIKSSVVQRIRQLINNLLSKLFNIQIVRIINNY